MASIEELEKRKNNRFHVEFENAGEYVVKTAKILTRRIIGIKDDEYELGPWEVVYCEDEIAQGVKNYIDLTGECAELGFSFDVKWGEDWPYSDCFWSINNDPIKSHVDICVGGKSRVPWIHIYVDGLKVVDKCNSPGREIIG